MIVVAYLVRCSSRVPKLAASSSSSCSPAKARLYNLHSKRAKTSPKMSTNRAYWDEGTTKLFLDLCIAEKNLMNFNSKGLTKLRWQHVYRNFKDQIGLRYDNKQLQNKLNTMRRTFMQWRSLQNQSGLGRDTNTGGIAADDSFWGTEGTETGEPGAEHPNRGKAQPFLEELNLLFGRTTQDRGTLLSAGGIHEPARNSGSEGTPPHMSEDPIGCSTIRATSKRPIREEVVAALKKEFELGRPHRKHF